MDWRSFPIRLAGALTRQWPGRRPASSITDTGVAARGRKPLTVTIQSPRILNPSRGPDVAAVAVLPRQEEPTASEVSQEPIKKGSSHRKRAMAGYRI